MKQILFYINSLQWVLFLVILYSCGQSSFTNHPSNNKNIIREQSGIDTNTNNFDESKTHIKMAPTCGDVMNALLLRQFNHWEGFPKNCDWTSLTGPLPEDWQLVPKRRLGSKYRDAQMIMLSLEGYIRASLNFVDGQAVLFEAMEPTLAIEIGDLLEKLGQPDTILDWDFGTLPCPQSELVYANKGITLFLNTEKTKLLHVALYPSVEPKTYEESLRPRLGKELR